MTATTLPQHYHGLTHVPISILDQGRGVAVICDLRLLRSGVLLISQISSLR